MSPWGWQPKRSQGIWRFGPLWLKPFAAVVPWLTVGILLLMLYLSNGALTVAEGVLLDLPDGNFGEGEPTDLVALVMPREAETLVFFDDARFTLGDEFSAGALKEQLMTRVSGVKRRTLLVLADERISVGDLNRFARIARESGVKRLFFANQHRREGEE